MPVIIPLGDVVGDIVADSGRVVADDQTCRDVSTSNMNRRNMSGRIAVIYGTW
jgi:hypothetical protein